MNLQTSLVKYLDQLQTLAFGGRIVGIRHFPQINNIEKNVYLIICFWFQGIVLHTKKVLARRIRIFFRNLGKSLKMTLYIGNLKPNFAMKNH